MIPDNRAQEEKQRLDTLLFNCGISAEKRIALEPIIENVAWMRGKLDDTREAIKSSGVVIAYDNGGGQKGLRENPLYKGYYSLFKSYMRGLDAILNVLPKDVASAQEAEIEKPKTVLELVRAKHKV